MSVIIDYSIPNRGVTPLNGGGVIFKPTTGGFQPPPPTSNPFNPGPIINAGCNLLPPGVLRDACMGIGGGLGGGVDPRGGGLGPLTPIACPTGYRHVSDGSCVKEGVVGAGERLIPGGQTGRLNPDAYGEAVQTALGVGLVPAQVMVPTLRCPPGMVLGKDSVCYARSVIPKSLRKWPAPPKPPMSAADAKALRRIGTLQAKAKRLAASAGLTMVKKPGVRGKKKKR